MVPESAAIDRPAVVSGRLTRFIVNADDLGATSGVNSAIFEALAARLITSASIMATGGAFDEAARTTREFPHASFGVHLNLTVHRPLTYSPGLQPLLSSNGDFRPGAVFEARPTAELRAAVLHEWTAQIMRAREAGVALTHLDSHQHVHTIPWMFPVLKQVQRVSGIRRVRGTFIIYDRSRKTLAKRLRKTVWRAALRSVVATRTTDEFADFLMFLRAVADGSYRPRIWPDTIELMVHPSDNAAFSGEESAALRSGWLQSLPCSAELISYEQI